MTDRKPETGQGCGASPPADAAREVLAAAVRRHGDRPDALIEILHDVQEGCGWLPRPVLAEVASRLRLPPSHVLGVATFYNFFSLVPPALHTCTVCVGTACHVERSGDLLDALAERGLAPGRTDAAGRVGVAVARCVGTCGLAPVVAYDGAMAARQRVEDVVARVRAWEEER